MNVKAKISSSIDYQYDFEQLISPITLDEFVSRYWEKEELILKRNNTCLLYTSPSPRD